MRGYLTVVRFLNIIFDVMQFNGSYVTYVQFGISKKTSVFVLWDFIYVLFPPINIHSENRQICFADC